MEIHDASHGDRRMKTRAISITIESGQRFELIDEGERDGLYISTYWGSMKISPSAANSIRIEEVK